MRARAYCAHPSIRDHWALRGMSRYPDQVVNLKHFYVKDAPRTCRPIVENVHKITEIIEVDRHVSSRSIDQELKINHKTDLNHLRKVGFKKKLDFVATPINT
ncbi:hypothetical protein TNCV_4303951 [Trichonephila clavipes]|nr:hypothetical protein TNCV_4303951 [Trichonephila clavipes]